MVNVSIAPFQVGSGERHGTVLILQDVTTRLQLEEHLQHSEKMASIGILAAGVAHEVNTPLTGIASYTQMLRAQVKPEDLRYPLLEKIEKQAFRAAKIINNLLNFSRSGGTEFERLDINKVVLEVLSLLEHQLDKNSIKVLKELGEDLPAIRGSENRLQQVFFNLVLNARDAMPRGGHLVIETGNVTFDAAYARLRPGLEPGPYAMLAVSDTGHGMPPTVLEHLFEPFFTTKERGKGTGLGLATVHGIVKQSGGHIFVYSEPGGGAAFKIYLPRLAEAAERESPFPVTAELPRGSETVLLVEDEAALRNLVRECLETSGYTVVEARHGGEALEIAERHRFPLHLLMTDVVMPGMSGRELAERLASRRAELRVLYMSGYTDDAVIRHGVLSQQMAFLQKPFTAEALARKVREVLDARVEAGGPST
jgi:signal transduction histidine kinase/ActR/RegA family two-component response regulator